MMTTSLWVAILVVLASVVFDVRTRTIPNIVTLGGLAAGLSIHAATGLVDGGLLGGLRGIGHALLGVVVCSLLPLITWKRGEMGGGDVKLFAALGALLGSGVGFDIQAKTFLISFVLIFPYRLLRHGVLKIALANLFARKSERVATPKLPPVILAPTIGVAFAFTVIAHGALGLVHP